MRVLMIAPEPFFEPRGTPFSVYHRTLALSRLGHRIDLVCYYIGEPVSIKGVRLERMARMPFIRKVKIGPSYTKIFLDIFVAFRALRLLFFRRYDALHCHEEAGLMGAVFKRIFRKRFIYDMHSCPSQQISNFEFSKSRLLIGLMRWIEGFVIRQADAVIVICPHLEQTVKRILPTAKTVLIENTPMAMDVEEVPADEVTKLREKYRLGNSRVILYTGTLEPYQGIDLLLKAMKRLETQLLDAKLLIVGGTPEQVAGYRAMSGKLGLENVIFTGQRPLAEMNAFMALSSVLASPRSKGTNTPLKIYSYLKSGVPIVATRLMTHTQVLDDSVAVLTKARPEDYAEGLKQALNDQPLRARLSENAKALAEREYSYQKFLAKTKAAYGMVS